MRFWQKIFLITLVILLVSFNIFSYIFVQNSFQTSLNKEISSRLEEVRLMRISLQTNSVYQKYLLGTDALNQPEIDTLLSDFSDTYSDSYSDTTLFFEPGSAGLADTAAEVDILSNGDSHTLQITSAFFIDDAAYRLVTQTDITEIYAGARQQISFSQQLSLILSLGSAVIVLIMSLVLTWQINDLRRSARKISHGVFFMRANVNSHDEIGELAEDFNRMADTVEDKVAELSQIAEDRKRFIDNIAHEMKTPLTSIIGFADLLRTAKLDSETTVEYADTIYREGQHLKNVSSKLMEIILLGKTTPSLQNTPVDNFLENIYQSLAHVCQNAGITLVYHAPQPDFSLDMDMELMKSLISNLVDNAIKASKPDSQIILTACAPGLDASGKQVPGADAPAYISVKDFGRGIPAEEISKITEPFYMLDKARTRKHGGAGLGLALCAEIAALHQGRLDIQSVLGEGTEMRIVFEKEDNKP